MNLTQEDITKLAIAGAMIFAAYKWGNGVVRAGAVSVAAGVIAKRVPYIKDVL